MLRAGPQKYVESPDLRNVSRADLRNMLRARPQKHRFLHPCDWEA